MKKAIALFATLFICCAFGSCALIGNIINTAQEQDDDAETVTTRTAEIVCCFDEKDADTLKGMFSERTLSEAVNIDSQIENAFKTYEGKSLSYDVSYAGMDGGKSNGIWYDKHATVKAGNIETDTGKKYVIAYTEYYIHEKKDKTGLLAISLLDRDGKVLAEIGPNP